VTVTNTYATAAKVISVVFVQGGLKRCIHFWESSIEGNT